jgi:hypothetical protein
VSVAGVFVGCALPGVALGADPGPPTYATPPAPQTPPTPAAPPAYGGPNPYQPPDYYFAMRSATINAQLAELRLKRDDISLAWPLTMLVGGGALIAGAIIAIEAGVCPTDEYGLQTDPSCRPKDQLVEVGVGAFLVGTVGVIAGTVSTIVRSARRSHISHQIRAREVELGTLRASPPRWTLAPTPNGGGTFSLALDF